MKNKLLRGIGASPGIAIARAVHYKYQISNVKYQMSNVEGSELYKFKSALDETRRQIESIRAGFLARTDPYHARIFDAQLLVLEDDTLIKTTIRKIKIGESAIVAFKSTLDGVLSGFEGIKDGYIKSRVADIRDVGNRVLRNLRGESRELKLRKERHIVIAEDLVPSDTARLDRAIVAGFVTDLGGETSHTSIMARALNIPAVVGLREVTRFVKPGEEVIVDGNHGIVVIDPDERTRRAYERRIQEFQNYEKGLLSLATLPCETLDGHSIGLACNLEVPEGLDVALAHGARGIGLMRTEFIYLDDKCGLKLPEEDKQYEIYNKIAKKVYPHSVIIRTLDLGGDKILAMEGREPIIKEANPFLGWRGIRVSLDRDEIFRTQLRAILRAGMNHNVKVLFPMIEGIKEVRLAKACLAKAENELTRAGIPHAKDIEVGVMIEVPGAALLAYPIAQEVDFLSIGSNDLTQYTLACDRTNPMVSDYYTPLHPGVLRLMKRTIDAAHRARKWVGLCGELAAYPPAIPILVGLEIDELSVSQIYLLEVKKIIRALTMDEARSIANDVMALETEEEVENYVRKIKEKLPVIREIMKKREE